MSVKPEWENPAWFINKLVIDSTSRMGNYVAVIMTAELPPPETIKTMFPDEYRIYAKYRIITGNYKGGIIKTHFGSVYNQAFKRIHLF